MRFRSGGYARSRANAFPSSFCSVNLRCAALCPISTNIITPKETIKARATNCCFLAQLHRNLPVAEQAGQVETVKRSEAGMVTDPVTCSPDNTLAEVDAMCARFRI